MSSTCPEPAQEMPLGTVISQVSLGAISVHQRKLRMKDLRRGGSLAREARHHVTHEPVEPLPQ